MLFRCFHGAFTAFLTRYPSVELTVAASDGRDIWLLTLPDLRHTSRVRAFMDHVEQQLRPQRPGNG